MKCNVEPYEGTRPFIFVSYCHKDQAQVYPYIEMLAREGYRIWYDEGITPGDEWTENIARHLNECSVFVAFITEDSMNSHNCRQEINFAVIKEKTLVSLFLDDVRLSPGMEMLLSDKQGIYRSRYALAHEFISRLMNAEGLDRCKGNARPDVHVMDRIGTEDKTVTLTQNAARLGPRNAETYLLYVTLQEKIQIRKSNFTIGRSEELADYAIPGDPSISRRHMTVRKKGDAYSVIDNHSVNHVGINGKLIAPDMEYEISSYDIISLAMEHMVFFQEYDEKSLQERYGILLRDGDETWSIGDKPITRIGSLPEDRNGRGNEICLPDSGIKEFHAVVIRAHNGIYLADISGGGRTFIDDEPLRYCRKRLLKPGSRIRIGERTLEVASRL